ncbi:hypothetical protein N7475_003624 [Penicillium sp. IBT 31633x]|nr:hypothetical protein N7475_003624 [Penicillium sp. IBT 31633x]
MSYPEPSVLKLMTQHAVQNAPRRPAVCQLVTGVLNQMLVSEPGGKANVCLHWDDFCGDVETQSEISWRVSVKAIKQIMPFEPLICMAAQHGQYELHLSSENAERGFLEIAISQ